MQLFLEYIHIFTKNLIQGEINSDESICWEIKILPTIVIEMDKETRMIQYEKIEIDIGLSIMEIL